MKKEHVFRKPKFMRDDSGMKDYIIIAETVSKELCKTDSIYEQYYYLKKINECLDKAAKAGGFLNTEDFVKWMRIQKNTKH